jgi:ADP-heptose:LPS heptosyltransferase
MQLKLIEHAWRKAWVRILSRALARTRGSRSSRTAGKGRVLFLRPDRIGDMIVSTGVLHAITESNPAIELHVLASPANAPVARGQPFIREVIVFDRKRPWRWPAMLVRLRAADYDAVVDCMPTAPSVTMLLLMGASGARERIGVAGRGNDHAFTTAVPPRPGARHIIDHLSALASAFGVDIGGRQFPPRLSLTSGERARAVATWHGAVPHTGATRRLLVNVSAGKAARHWPEERFVEILALVRRRFPEVQPLVIGGTSEASRTLAIARAAGVATASTPTFREALALVATADVVLSADTGLAHAAAAFRRPAIVLHRRGSSERWGLYGAPGTAIECEGESLSSLAVAPVWHALESLLCLETPSATARSRATAGLLQMDNDHAIRASHTIDRRVLRPR